jgi:two-component system nitrogen regulation response regulator GlnG
MALGYSAKSTDSFDQGLWLVESENVDVAFLSIKGRDFIAKLQQLKEKRPGVEVIAVTNNESMRFAIEAMKAGAYEVISKPFGLAEVKRVLQNVEKHLKDTIELELRGKRTDLPAASQTWWGIRRRWKCSIG